MAIVNRRNAVLGWVVWRVAKRKVRGMVPGGEDGSRVPGPSVVVPGLAALGAAGWLWRRRRRQNGDEPVG